MNVLDEGDEDAIGWWPVLEVNGGEGP